MAPKRQPNRQLADDLRTKASKIQKAGRQPGQQKLFFGAPTPKALLGLPRSTAVNEDERPADRPLPIERSQKPIGASTPVEDEDDAPATPVVGSTDDAPIELSEDESIVEDEEDDEEATELAADYAGIASSSEVNNDASTDTATEWLDGYIPKHDNWYPRNFEELIEHMLAETYVYVQQRAETVFFLPQYSLDSLTQEYIRQLRDTSETAYQYMNECIQACEPWKITEIMSSLPDGRNQEYSGKIAGNYLWHLLCRVKSTRHLKTFAYTGCVYSLWRTILQRSSEHSDPHYRERNSSRAFYQQWDHDDHEVESVRCGVVLRQSKSNIAQWGPTLTLLFETVDTALFGGWLPYYVGGPPQLLPRALMETWRISLELDEDATYATIMQHGFGAEPTNKSVPALRECARVTTIQSRPKRYRPDIPTTALDRLAVNDGHTFLNVKRVDSNMDPNGTWASGKAPQIALTPQFVLHSFSYLEWARMRDQLNFSANNKCCELTVSHSVGFNPENWANLSKDYSHPEMPDASRMKLSLAFVDKLGVTQEVVLQQKFYAPSTPDVLQDKRAIRAQSLFEYIFGNREDSNKGPYRHDFNVWVSEQGAMAYDDETKLQAAPTTAEKTARSGQSHQSFKARGDLCKVCNETIGASIGASRIYEHLGLYTAAHKERSIGKKREWSKVKRSEADSRRCRQGHVELLRHQGVLTHLDVRSPDIAILYGVSSKAVTTALNNPAWAKYDSQMKKAIENGQRDNKGLLIKV